MKHVLLAEDNEDDAYLWEVACRRSGFPLMCQVVADGQRAIDYFAAAREPGNRISHPIPDVLFLDIKMPKRNGFEVLEWVRRDLDFSWMPIIMLTSSVLQIDVKRAYELGASSYLQKGFDLGEFSRSLQLILKYWLELNIPPR